LIGGGLYPRNDLVRGGAFCLAETGKLYVFYLPHPASVTVMLAPGAITTPAGSIRAQEDGLTRPLPAAPLWMPPAPADDGDWVLLLRHDPQLRDTTPPAPVAATASLARKEVLVIFTEAIDSRSIVAGNFALEPAVTVLGRQARR
jgi:hypothetical protein